MTAIIVIKRIQILDANALSSPYTIGFPAITAWLGAVHALQRHINKKAGYKNVVFSSAAVVCHNMQLRVHETENNISFISLTRNPLNEKGKPSSIVQEAKCHLEVSLIIECQNIPSTGKDEELFIKELQKLILSKVRFAGGSVISNIKDRGIKIESKDADSKKIGDDILDTLLKIEIMRSEDDDPQKLMAQLMPGYALIERSDLMIEEMKKGDDALDALLKYVKITNQPREHKGWIVPIAVGFQAISNLSDSGTVKGQRDPNVCHRFAESIVTLGEFKMPYRIKKLSEIMWRYHFNKESGLYLCQNF